MDIPQSYLWAGILLVIAVGMGLAMVALPSIVSRVLRVNRPSEAKVEPYECGMHPIGGARARFSVKFYVVAMLFILFDIEAIFLYPWAMVHRWLGWFGLIEVGIFVAILLVGFVYVWKRGALQWQE